MAQQPLISRILQMYGLEPEHVATRQAGYRNHSYRATLMDGRQVNIILYKREPGILARIRRANRVSNFLSSNGFPARQSLGHGIIKLSTEGYTRYAALYTYLPGATIPWEAYKKVHLKLLGATMSNMHEALAKLPDARTQLAGSNAVQEYSDIVARMGTYFADLGVQAAIRSNLSLSTSPRFTRRFQTALDACDRLPHQQALHLDFVRGNILFDATATVPFVSGILDFEKTAYGAPIMDIARTLAFLLVDSKFKSEHEVRKYFLLSGYNKRGRVSFRPIQISSHGGHINLLEELLDLFLTYDFYKFLRHNPYNSLSQNEHYTRTRDLLLSRGLMVSTIATHKIAARVAEPVL